MMPKQFFITGIGTDVGKTIVSAIVAESLKATYWKPIQAGDLHQLDSGTVNSLTDNVEILIEGMTLSQPMSPHAAARIDGVEIGLTDFNLPLVDGNFIVEGAGGLMVPLNDDRLMLVDLIEKFNLPVILVSRHYLGSINHTLLSIELLQNRGLQIEGIIFVGDENVESERSILSYSKLKMLARIPEVDEVNKEFVLREAAKMIW